MTTASALRARPRARRRDRRGFALPTALIGLLGVTMLALAIYATAEVESRASKNRVASARATLLAEQAAVHALRLLQDSLRGTTFTRLLRGADNITGTADDGRLVGHGLSAAAEIPAAGKAGVYGTYEVLLLDDPADPDGVNLVDRNHRLLARCTARTTDGSRATIEVIFQGPPTPGVAIGGDLKIGGKPAITGKCGGLQANGNIEVGAEPTVVEGYLAATGSVGPKAIVRPNGTTNVPETGAPPVVIPDLNPLDHCATADYVAQADGWIRRVSDNTLHDATSTAKFGWKRSGTGPTKWDFDAVGSAEGTFCFHGNVFLSANPGSAADPFELSIYASGSVEISGNPYLRPAPGDSVVLVAGGDLSISGNPVAGGTSYAGLIYAESQCKVSGTPVLSGAFWCLSKANAAGTVELTSLNEFSGDARFGYDCGGAAMRLRRDVYWVQPPG